ARDRDGGPLAARSDSSRCRGCRAGLRRSRVDGRGGALSRVPQAVRPSTRDRRRDRKSTRLNSSHVEISYAVFCLKKKKKNRRSTARKKKKHIALKNAHKRHRRTSIPNDIVLYIKSSRLLSTLLGTDNTLSLRNRQ